MMSAVEDFATMGEVPKAPLKFEEIKAQIKERMIGTITMANEICLYKPFMNCGDVARATATAIIAAEIFDELKEYYYPPPKLA